MAPDTAAVGRNYIDGAFADGGAGRVASLVAGGHRLNRPGYFFQPAVFIGVTPDMAIACEAVFGPVLAVIPFSSEDVAIRL